MTLRRTKIVATLGPASSSPDVLEKMILAGLDVARLNFSHGSPEEHRARANLVRELAASVEGLIAFCSAGCAARIAQAKSEARQC